MIGIIIIIKIIIIIIFVFIIIGCTALCGPWPQADVASDVYPAQSLANLYNPFSLRLPLSPQPILILVGHILGDLQGLSIMSF